MMDLNNAHFTPSLSVSLFVHCDLFQALAPTSLRAQYALDPVAELQTKRTAVSLMPTPFARPTQPSNGSFFLGWTRNVRRQVQSFEQYHGRRYMPMGQTTWISREAQDAVCNCSPTRSRRTLWKIANWLSLPYELD